VTDYTNESVLMELISWVQEISSLKQFVFSIFIETGAPSYRSQSRRGLRHELSSPAQTMGLWARIPLEAWMSVCVYSVFVPSCVQVVALQLTDPPSKESYRLCRSSKNRKSG
jgi:hypothetical protein